MRVSGSLTSVIDFTSSHFVVQVPSTDGTDETTGGAAAVGMASDVDARETVSTLAGTTCNLVASLR